VRPGALAALAAVGLFVAAANALNMVLERESDREMERTRLRPLPDGRLALADALAFGLGLAALAIVGTALVVNPLTSLLGVIALIVYVLVYTPMKRRSPAAVLVGAVAGAMPPLMGWTAATGAIGLPGLAVFLTVGLWQVPHFLAIAIYRRDEYARAGIRTVVAVRGERAARRGILLYTVLLVGASGLLPVLGAAGPVYLVGAGVGGLFLLAEAVRGQRQAVERAASDRWARQLFRLTLVYLPLLLLALAADGALV